MPVGKIPLGKAFLLVYNRGSRFPHKGGFLMVQIDQSNFISFLPEGWFSARLPALERARAMGRQV